MTPHLTNHSKPLDRSLNIKIMKEAILSILDQESKKAHKWNIIGRPFQRGSLEQRLNTTFTPEDRALASAVFEQLKVDGFVQPTFSDIADPENWVTITELGKQFLKSGLRDAIDIHLAEIGEHLIELRAGMHDAAARTSPDAPRQAANSARELIDHVLKDGAPLECETRKQRINYLLRKHDIDKSVSRSDGSVIEASARLIEAEHNKAIAMAHARGSSTARDARIIVENAERMLRLLFQI
jgi:hypothetical protein